MCKCEFPDGLVIKPDGENELDPCLYEQIEFHTNCAVTISRCMRCGNIDISWVKNEGCESYNPQTYEPI